MFRAHGRYDKVQIRTKIPAENELSTPIDMSSAAPLCEKKDLTPTPMAMPLSC